MSNSLIFDLFNKPIQQLELADLELFFTDQKTESNVIELKSYLDFSNSYSTKNSRDKEKLNDILKSICAFLNSDGGILIWGAPEGKKVEELKEKVYSGNLTPVKYRLEKDGFINRVANELSPMPHRVMFHQIPVNQDSFCYIFEVYKSEFAPHQIKGAYYIRLDGCTRPAPHYYVEALVKKISFPKIEAFLNFGEMMSGSKYAFLPLAFTVHNTSKYLNEKNVEYRISCPTCDILQPNETLHTTSINGCDIQKKAKDILHYNMPYFEEYVLVTDRLLFNSNPISADILLTVWGEYSPVVACMYKLEIYGHRANTKYHLTEKKENFYLYQESDEKGNDQRIKNSNDQLLKSFEKRFHTFPLFKQLY